MASIKRIFMNGAGSTSLDFEVYFSHSLFFHLALFRFDKVGPVTFKKCLKTFGSAEKTIKASSQELMDVGLTKKTIEQCQGFKKALQKKESQLQNNPIFKGIKQDIDWEAQPNHVIVSSDDSKYPKLLKQIYDYPPLLFVIGSVDLLSSAQMAIVGSRRPSKIGATNAQSFSKDLSSKGLTVTSGLASGIDTFAHMGALESERKVTIAVLAHGLDGIYPKSNQVLAAKIINLGGALVSEFPIGVRPRPEYFPRRNRIISGMSEGVLVVEAAVKSGSLITAYSALDQNREVFAIPGSIHNPVARGCHKLIQSGAKLVECCEDILEELNHINLQPINHANAKYKKDKVEGLNIDLSMEEKMLLKTLSHEEQTQNELAQQLNIPIHEISSTLTFLELKGLVLQGEVGFMKAPS